MSLSSPSGGGSMKNMGSINTKDAQLQMAAERALANASKVELTFNETNRARTLFMATVHEFITTTYELRTVLSNMGIYPPDEELTEVMNIFQNKMQFNDFCRYLVFQKIRFQRPEPRDVDTLRAFVALGGGDDRQGDISTNGLRDTIKKFALTIDIDGMLRTIDTNNSGSVDYTEFRAMWDANLDHSIRTGMPPEQHPLHLTEDQEAEMVELIADGDALAEKYPLGGGATGLSTGGTEEPPIQGMSPEQSAAVRAAIQHLPLEEQLRQLRELRRAEALVQASAVSTSTGKNGLRRRASSMRRVESSALDEIDQIVLLRMFMAMGKGTPPQTAHQTTSRQPMKRRASRLYASMRMSFLGSRFPQIGAGRSVLANNAAEFLSGSMSPGRKSSSGGLSPSGPNPNANIGIGEVQHVESDEEPAEQPEPEKPKEREKERNTYRAPSPMILSQYAAIRVKGTGKLKAAKAPVPPPGYGLRKSPRSTQSSPKRASRQ